MSAVAEEKGATRRRGWPRDCARRHPTPVSSCPGLCRTRSEDGLALCDQLGVTKLGIGVVLHTAPETPKELPRLLGYADNTGQWYPDGTKLAQDEDVMHVCEGTVR